MRRGEVSLPGIIEEFKPDDLKCSNLLEEHFCLLLPCLFKLRSLAKIDLFVHIFTILYGMKYFIRSNRVIMETTKRIIGIFCDFLV